MDPSQPSFLGLRDNGTQLLLFIVLLFFSMLIGQAVGLGIAELGNIDLQALSRGELPESSQSSRNTLRLIALANQLFSFLLPALFWGWFFYRSDWTRFFRLHRLPSLSLAGLGSLWLLVSFPLIQYVYWLNKYKIPLPEWATRMEDSASGLIQSFLEMNTSGEYLLSLLVIAILPALGEEMVFRGIFQKGLENRLKRPHVAIWITAILFSAVHFQFEGFLPRVLLGGILGYLYFWSRNLWVPVIAHFFNNGLQVTAAFVADQELFELEESEAAAKNPVEWSVLLGSVLLVGMIGYSLWKQRKEEEAGPPSDDSPHL